MGQRGVCIAKYIVPAFAFKLIPGEVISELGFVRKRGRDMEGIIGRANIKPKVLDLASASIMFQKENMWVGARISPCIYAEEFGFYPEGYENLLKDCKPDHDMTGIVI